MAWVKIDDRIAENPKLIEAGPVAAWMYIAGIGYCSRNLTDGHIPAAVAVHLISFRYPLRIISKLLQCALWVRSPSGGYLVHDYLEYQQSKAQVADIAAKRAVSGQKGGKQKASNLLGVRQNIALPDTDTDTDTERVGESLDSFANATESRATRARAGTREKAPKKAPTGAPAQAYEAMVAALVESERVADRASIPNEIVTEQCIILAACLKRLNGSLPDPVAAVASYTRYMIGTRRPDFLIDAKSVSAGLSAYVQAGMPDPPAANGNGRHATPVPAKRAATKYPDDLSKYATPEQIQEMQESARVVTNP